MFSSFSLVDVLTEGQILTIYRPLDVPLAASLWNMVQDFDAVTLVSELLTHTLSLPFDAPRLGLAWEYAAVLLLILYCHRHQSSHEVDLGRHLDVVGVFDVLLANGTTYMNKAKKVDILHECPEALRGWVMGAVQVQSFSKDQFDSDHFTNTLFLAFLHRAILVPPPGMPGVDFLVPMVNLTELEILVALMNQNKTNDSDIKDFIGHHVGCVAVQVKSSKKREATTPIYVKMANVINERFKTVYVIVNFGAELKSPKQLPGGKFLTLLNVPSNVTEVAHDLKAKIEPNRMPIEAAFGRHLISQNQVKTTGTTPKKRTALAPQP
ncbi:hypothetical protein GEMRC1_007750 [Eukaryota sp. GEM-RC1]